MERLPVLRIVMPVPWAMGPVNAYLIEAEPFTLVDAGINAPAAHNALVIALTSAGFFLESIQRVLVTHAHPDHYGLVHVIQESSGATVYFPRREIERVRDRQMSSRWGACSRGRDSPGASVQDGPGAQEGSSSPAQARRGHPVGDGDRFELETSEGLFELEAMDMPGHTGGHMVYVERASGTMFAGDQLLPDVSPNPLLEPSLDEPGERRRSLREYLESLEKMAALELTLAYPGHGDAITDPGALIARTIEHHSKRKAAVAGHLGREGKSPYEVAREIYPKVTGYDVFLGVSEVVAHLDLVAEDGDVIVDERDGVTYYRAP